MEKKKEEKKMDPKTSWAQVAKKATSTSGSGFAGAAAGGAWASSGAAVGGAWASSGTNEQSSRPVPPAWPSLTPYKSVPQR